MKIDKELLINLADLAKLKLSDKELDMFSEQLTEIVSFVEKLKEIKTDVEIKQEYLCLDDISRLDEQISWSEDEKEIALGQKNKKTSLIKAPKIR